MRRAVVGTVFFLLPMLGMGVYQGWRLLRPSRPVAAPREFTVLRGDMVLEVGGTGTVEPIKKVELKSKVGGKVLRLLAAEGDRVRAGQVLAMLDPIEQESQVAQIREQVAAARARLSQARTQARHEGRQVPLGIADAQKQLDAARTRLKRALREASIQPALTRAAVAQAQADLRGARQALGRLNRADRPQELADVQAGYEQARAETELADKELARQRELLALGAVAPSAVDVAERETATARARLRAADTRVLTVRESVETNRQEAEERVARAEAALAAARANEAQITLSEDDVNVARAGHEAAAVALRRAREQQTLVKVRDDESLAAGANLRQLENSLREMETYLRDTVMRASISGIVTRRYVEEGELVTSGIETFSSGTPVMQIADLSRMQVRMQVNEVDVARVRVGQRARIDLDAARGGSLRGRVTRVAPASAVPPASLLAPDLVGGGNAAPGGGIVKFEVRIDILETDARLRPGMSTNVDIITDERRNILLLPLDAVDLEQSRVKRHVGEKVVSAPVTLGVRNDRQVEIRSGLRVGDRVLLADYTGPARRSLDLQTGLDAE